jgi:signal transduction histidine kinase
MEQTLLRTDHRHAERLGRALAMAAGPALEQRSYQTLDEFTNELVRTESVLYVVIVDKDNQIVSSSSKDGMVSLWEPRCKKDVTASVADRWDADHLLVARPIQARDRVWYEQRISGGVRLVLDTSATQQTLANLHERTILTAAGVTLAGIPLAMILVSLILLRPIQRLLQVAKQLGGGNFDVRTNLDNRDETGELAYAIDVMAEEISSGRKHLMAYNDELERKVALRTEELQMANQRLQEEMRDKEEFLRAVSHDLNAPLRNIAGMATMIMMKHRHELPEEVLARLQRIQGNVDTQTSLLTELLELSRIRTRPQKREVVDLTELLGMIALQFEYELQNRKIELVIPPSLPTLWAEPNRIRQVFQNLIDNAIKYMNREEGGRVELEYRSGMMHQFCIKDNGPGIPHDQLQKIFCVFRRGKTSNTLHVEGKGIGLAVVRTIVSTYEGRVWVESREGEGTRMYFTLSARSTRMPDNLPRPVGNDATVSIDASSQNDSPREEDG